MEVHRFSLDLPSHPRLDSLPHACDSHITHSPSTTTLKNRPILSVIKPLYNSQFHNHDSPLVVLCKPYLVGHPLPALQNSLSPSSPPPPPGVPSGVLVISPWTQKAATILKLSVLVPKGKPRKSRQTVVLKDHLPIKDGRSALAKSRCAISAIGGHQTFCSGVKFARSMFAKRVSLTTC